MIARPSSRVAERRAGKGGASQVTHAGHEHDERAITGDVATDAVLRGIPVDGGLGIWERPRRGLALGGETSESLTHLLGPQPGTELDHPFDRHRSGIGLGVTHSYGDDDRLTRSPRAPPRRR